MTEGMRIREIRKSLKLTMEQFGEQIGVSKQTISNIENDNRAATEHMKKSIVREFNVNPEWLRNGTGTMFKERTRYEQIEEWIGDILSNEKESYKVWLISALAEMDPAGWDAIYKVAKKIVDGVEDISSAGSIPGSPESVAAAEAAYEEALGIAPNEKSSTSSTSEDTMEKIS